MTKHNNPNKSLNDVQPSVSVNVKDVHTAAKYAVTCVRLNIRKNPTMDSDIMGLLTEKTEITILETTTVNDVVWGKLENGNWINLTYCAEVK